MNKHVVQPGQALSIRWRDAMKDRIPVYESLRRLRLTPDDNGNPMASAFCTHVSPVGISVYIVRGYNYDGDIQGFLPKGDVNWQAFFEPYDLFVESYASGKHYTAVFPRDFL